MMKKTSSNNHLSNHVPKNNVQGAARKGWLSPRFSLRDYGFCMATLLLFCMGSLFYQLNGGPPQLLLDLRLYLGCHGDWYSIPDRSGRGATPTDVTSDPETQFSSTASGGRLTEGESS